MAEADDRIGGARALPRSQIGALFALLASRGYDVFGPTVRDGAIVVDRLSGPASLPVGWTDAQAPGKYRLTRRDDDALFGFANGPSGWKGLLFPAREPLYGMARRADGRVGVAPLAADTGPRALLGVRACDLAAMRVQDRVFLEGPYEEARYARRRAQALVIGVNCQQAGSLCFCASTGTGPRVGQGADLVLTELGDTILIEVGSALGEDLAAALPLTCAEDGVLAQRDEGLRRTERAMSRSLDLAGLPELLFGNLEHPRWEDVATRCLSCGNCTQVCPTCFCAGVEEQTDLAREEDVRTRVWESCFTGDHARIHGFDPRPTTHDRYRQWLTHKVGSWVAQFGVSGCVGCGRCISFCPVGIDLTEEVAAIRAHAEPPVALPAFRAAAATDHRDTLLPRAARVLAVRAETSDVVTLTLAPEAPTPFAPGQFHMLSLPGIGEAAISIAGGRPEAVEHTVRDVGAVSCALSALDPGDTVWLRGPYGRGWPIEALDRAEQVTFVAGGIGLAPLRSAVCHLLASPNGAARVRVLYGARTPADRLYLDELDQWRARGARVEVTVDRAGADYRGHVGVVTRLLRTVPLAPGGLYLVCGPEVMMRFTASGLMEQGVAEEQVYLSMERNMKCAAGVCGRCQYGPYFVCKDGPVFRLSELRTLLGRDGF